MHGSDDPVYKRLLDAMLRTPMPAHVENGPDGPVVSMNPHKTTAAILAADPGLAALLRVGLAVQQDRRSADALEIGKAWLDAVEALPPDDTGVAPLLRVERAPDGCVTAETHLDDDLVGVRAGDAAGALAMLRGALEARAKPPQ
jgi:hypothetical protein